MYMILPIGNLCCLFNRNISSNCKSMKNERLGQKIFARLKLLRPWNQCPFDCSRNIQFESQMVYVPHQYAIMDRQLPKVATDYSRFPYSVFVFGFPKVCCCMTVPVVIRGSSISFCDVDV